MLANPANRGRAVALTFDQFRYGWANALTEEDAKQLHETFHVPGPGAPVFQAATANLNPWTEAKVDTMNPGRGPLLIISGEKDHTMPWAIVNASFKKQRSNPDVTEIVKIPNRVTRSRSTAAGARSPTRRLPSSGDSSSELNLAACKRTLGEKAGEGRSVVRRDR